MILDKELKFLEDNIVIYYAGLDDESLPFNKGEIFISQTANDQIIYLKALSLVVDYIAVPPSFYILWSHYVKSNVLLRDLLQLYEAGIVISPIYIGMNCATDFLDFKMYSNDTKDQRLIRANKKRLYYLFKNIPVLHRNVKIQSDGFKDILINEIGNNKIRKDITYLIYDFLEESNKFNISASRNTLERKLYNLYNSKILTPYEFKKFYYIVNKSYYKQGARTYSANISLLYAEKYSILGRDMFAEDNSILLAYDPLVLISILENFGITKQILSSLKINDIVKIRSTKTFSKFKLLYKQFAEELQKLEILSKRISKNHLKHVKEKIKTRFIQKYFKEMANYESIKKKWELSEMIFYSLALGSIGFVVIPLVSAILGFLPIILYKSGISLSLSNYIIYNLNSKEVSFFSFIEYLKNIIREIEVEDTKFKV